MAIGKKLEDLLKLRNTNPNQLSKNTGLSVATIYSIIRRDNMKVNLDDLQKIANELCVTLDYFTDTTQKTTMDIGNKIRELREAANMTQTELAEKLHTTKQTIHKYENNIVLNIPMNKLELIAKALNTTPAYLMGWEDTSKANIEENKTNTIKFIGRDGTVEVKHFSDEEYAIVKKMLSALPDMDEDL